MILQAIAAFNKHLSETLAGMQVQMPAVKVGAQAIHAQDAPPRIVWVPGEEVIGPSEGQGGDGVVNPRPLFTRRLSLHAHIWAVDIDAAELLINHLVAAVHDVAFGAYVAKSGTWLHNAADVTAHGVVYVLTLELKIPITRERDITQVVETVPITPDIVLIGEED